MKALNSSPSTANKKKKVERKKNETSSFQDS
jgi:hypothetical protein